MTKRSKYYAKFLSGRQMYGPGCCGHSRNVPRHPRGRWWLDDAHVRALKLRGSHA